MLQEAVVRILIRERAKLTAYIWSIVRDVHITDDVYQTVCVRAIAKQDQVRDEAHLMAWSRRVARDEAVTVLRRSSAKPLVFDASVLDLIESDWQAEDARMSNETVEALQNCIEELTPNSQQIVRMRYMQNLPGVEVASRLGRKIDAVYKALTRIHHTLSECIEHRLQGREASDS